MRILSSHWSCQHSLWTATSAVLSYNFSADPVTLHFAQADQHLDRGSKRPKIPYLTGLVPLRQTQRQENAGQAHILTAETFDREKQG